MHFMGGSGELPIRGLGPGLAGGLWLGVDIQPDNASEMPVFTTAGPAVAGLRLYVNADNIVGRVRLELRDDDSRRLVGYADPSRAIGKRVICTVSPKQSRIRFYEIQPWAAGRVLTTSYLEQGGARSFENFPELFHLAQAETADLRVEFHGRLAEFFIGTGAYPPNKVTALKDATQNTGTVELASAPPSVELRREFLRQLAELRSFANMSAMNEQAFRQSALIAYQWLIDRSPMLLRIGNGFGIQVSLPGRSDAAPGYETSVLADEPLILQRSGYHNSPLGYRWVSLQEFNAEAVFYIGKRPVSNRDFVDLVRNKLGPAHFDEDRTVLQRELLAITAGLHLDGVPSLVYQMRGLAEALIMSASACGLETWASR
jgi:hypothetical protein